MVKSRLKCFGLIKPSSGFYEIVARTTMNVSIKIKGVEKVYREKDS